MAGEMTDSDNLQKITGAVFAFVGVLIVLGAVAWSVNIYRFIGGATATEGIVTSLDAGGSHPRIKFDDAAGKAIEYSQNGLIFGYRVGDQAVVLYDPQNPRRATVETFGALWGFNLLAFVLGGVFLGAAGFKFISLRQSNSTQSANK